MTTKPPTNLKPGETILWSVETSKFKKQEYLNTKDVEPLLDWFIAIFVPCLFIFDYFLRLNPDTIQNGWLVVRHGQEIADKFDLFFFFPLIGLLWAYAVCKLILSKKYLALRTTVYYISNQRVIWSDKENEIIRTLVLADIADAHIDSAETDKVFRPTDSIVVRTTRKQLRTYHIALLDDPEETLAALKTVIKECAPV